MSLWARKSIAAVTAEAHGDSDTASPRLRRTLGIVDLTLIGIGCTIGAGIGVLTGTAAANDTGPVVALSFSPAGFPQFVQCHPYGWISHARRYRPGSGNVRGN